VLSTDTLLVFLLRGWEMETARGKQSAVIYSSAYKSNESYYGCLIASLPHYEGNGIYYMDPPRGVVIRPNVSHFSTSSRAEAADGDSQAALWTFDRAARTFAVYVVRARL